MPGVAAAHASFVTSQPPDVCGPLATPRLSSQDPRCQSGILLDQAPAAVHITFSEAVQVVGRGIHVLAPSGRPVEQGKATVEGNQVSVPLDVSEPGTYVVQWQVVSEDTHPARGSFDFSVGQVSPPAAGAAGGVGQVTLLGLALQSIGRWLHFAGFAWGFGVLGATVLLSRLDGTASLPARRLWRLQSWGILLLLAAEPLALVGQTSSFGASEALDGDAIGDALASPFGRLLAFRIAAALLLWVLAGSLHQEAPLAAEGTEQIADRFARDAAHPSVNQPLAWGAALGLGLVLALIDGLGQHAASFQPEWLGLAIHALHLLGMSLWLGSVSVAIVVWREGKSIQAAGQVAAAGFGALTVSGLAMAVVHVGGPAAVLETTYGQTLLAKQAPIAVAVLLGWLALRRGETPSPTAAGEGTRLQAASGRIRLLELGALGLVTGLAALLVSLPPPH